MPGSASSEALSRSPGSSRAASWARRQSSRSWPAGPFRGDRAAGERGPHASPGGTVERAQRLVYPQVGQERSRHGGDAPSSWVGSGVVTPRIGGATSHARPRARYGGHQDITPEEWGRRDIRPPLPCCKGDEPWGAAGPRPSRRRWPESSSTAPPRWISTPFSVRSVVGPRPPPGAGVEDDYDDPYARYLDDEDAAGVDARIGRGRLREPPRPMRHVIRASDLCHPSSRAHHRDGCGVPAGMYRQQQRQRWSR